MFTVIIILAILASVLLILAVLIQNPKGGGIAANFSAANQIAGVKKTNEFIEKATWTLAIALMLLAVGSRFVYTPDTQKTNDFLDRLEESTPVIPSTDNLGAGVPEGIPSVEVPADATPK
ncbi:preprotein translocase subunit SecG [Bacteroidia bacterium]|jgi:preprotein translocase subunit SecG|nr:preprotein translocase subunit SecG [Bacteroidota bacterium]MDB4173396.1 preprotein translocase subunit SecG [Bacteroidia bacterium]